MNAVEQQQQRALCLFSVAVHEAGHCIGFERAGLAIAKARVVMPTPETFFGYTTLETPPAPMRISDFYDRTIVPEFDKLAVAAYAGPIAERAVTTGRHVKFPRSDDLAQRSGDSGHSDITHVQAAGDSLFYFGWTARVTREAVALLRDEWDNIIERAMRIAQDSADALTTETLDDHVAMYDLCGGSFDKELELLS